MRRRDAPDFITGRLHDHLLGTKVVFIQDTSNRLSRRYFIILNPIGSLNPKTVSSAPGKLSSAEPVGCRRPGRKCPSASTLPPFRQMPIAPAAPHTLPTAPDGAGKRPQAPAHLTRRLAQTSRKHTLIDYLVERQ